MAQSPQDNIQTSCQFKNGDTTKYDQELGRKISAHSMENVYSSFVSRRKLAKN